jgi:hypothetical protein
MPATSRLFEMLHFVHAMPSGIQAAYEDLYNGSPATDVVNLSKYGSVLWIIQEAAGGTGTATITVERCDDAVPTTQNAIRFDYWISTTSDVWSARTRAAVAGFGTSASANAMYAIEAHAVDLVGDNYIRLQCDETESTAVDGTIFCILGNPRYAEDITATVLT